MSSASLSLAPSLFSGFRLISCNQHKTHMYICVSIPSLSDGSDLPHDRDGLRGEEPRVAHVVIDDRVKHLLLIVTREGTFPNQHLIDQYP